MGGKSGGQVVGYKYFFGIHMALGRGPVDELVEIRVGDLTAWQGSVTQSSSITIDAPDLFGGEQKEGGIQGQADIMMGEDTQPINPRVASMVGGLVPAFRRMMSIFFDGEVCAMNPYPKTWKMRVRRGVMGWDGDVFYPEKAVIKMANSTIFAMNGSHILYECATNREWGRGLPRTLVDTDAFISAANTLCNECFGLCLRWARQDDLDSFVQQVLDHIGGVVYFARDTGLWTLRLIRQDYDVATLPTFDENSGMLAIEEDASSTDAAINEQLVTYHDPVADEDRQVRVQNLGNMQAVGAIYSQTTTYTGIPTPDLASRVAMRDLKALGTPLKRYTITLDRRGYKIAPGDVFVISVPSLSITNIILRAGKVEDGKYEDGSLKITAVQDVFGMPATTYQDVEPPRYVPPDRTPIPTKKYRAFEATYRDGAHELTAAQLASVDPTSGTVECVAQRPNTSSLSYQLWTGIDGSGTLEKAMSVQFCPTVDVAGLGLTTYGEKLTFTNGFDVSLVAPPSVAVVDDEMIEVTSVDSVTLVAQIKRGCVDTIPNPHPPGSTVWIYDDANGGDGKEYISGEVVDCQFRTQTSAGVLAANMSSTTSVAIDARQGKPYICGNMQVNGKLLGLATVVGGDLAFTWAHRDRIIQGDMLVGHTEASTGPEPGTTYNLHLYDDTGALIIEQIGVTDDHYTFAEADVAHGSGATIRVVIEAMRDGIKSYQWYDWTFQHYLSTDAGWSIAYGEHWGE